MKIEIISGSPREQSITRRVALHLAQQLQASTPHDVAILDIKDWDMPAVQTVFNSIENTPEKYKALSKRIFEADAFILVTPEYNGSYSPAMKNMLDHFPKQRHKTFGLVTASPGALGGMRAAQQLLLLVPALFGIASPYLLVVPFIDKKFAVDGSITDVAFANTVHNFTTEFLWLAEKVVTEKATV
jgi:NAD(P)H-dependent FMN reductase